MLGIAFIFSKQSEAKEVMTLLKKYIPWNEDILNVLVRGNNRCLAIWKGDRRYAWDDYDYLKKTSDWTLYENLVLGNELLEMLAEREPWIFSDKCWRR